VKLLNLTLDDTLELNERYLQAVGISTRPNPAVILDLLKMLENPGVENKKLKQTFILTIASAMKKYAELPGNSYGSKVVEKVETYILGSLEKCGKDEDCKLLYIRGLQNLKSPNTVTLLQSYAVDGTASISVAAMKALRTYRPDLWTSNDKKILKAIFYQRRKKYDTSARAIALDMLLESKLSDDDLTEMVQFLKSNDKAFEVKQYLYQKLKMKAQSNNLFKTKFESIVKGDKSLNNYNILGVRGLTTALARVFSTTPSFNATLISIQEINSGLLKQGLVDLVMHTNNEKFSMLSVSNFIMVLNIIFNTKFLGRALCCRSIVFRWRVQRRGYRRRRSCNSWHGNWCTRDKFKAIGIFQW
jgi:microsomal triglyceride transfer protein large subunit